MAKSSNVAKKEENNLPATSGMPEWMKQYAGEGQENIEREDILVPRLKLGQSMTPEVKDGKAEEGDFIHNITGEVICKAGEEIPVICVAWSKEYILWRDRKTGGGIMARARRVKDNNGFTRYKWDNPNTTFEDKLGGKMAVKYTTKTFIDEDGLHLWGTQVPGDKNSPPAATEHYNFLLLLPTKGDQLIAASLARTANPAGKRFLTLLNGGQIPTFARIYRLQSIPDQRDDNRFANWFFSGDFDVIQDEQRFLKMRELHEMLEERGINVDFSDDDAETEAPEESEAF